MELNEIVLRVDNSFIEMQALMTERDGMIAENEVRSDLGRSLAYVEDSFLIIAEKMRALKKEEVKDGNTKNDPSRISGN